MIHNIVHNLAHDVTAVPQYLDGRVKEVVDIAKDFKGRFTNIVVVVEEVRAEEEQGAIPCSESRVYVWVVAKDEGGKRYVLVSENFSPTADWAGKVYELFGKFMADRIVSPNADVALALQLMFSSIPPARISTSLAIA